MNVANIEECIDLKNLSEQILFDAAEDYKKENKCSYCKIFLIKL